MIDRRDFLQAIQAQPADDTPRLIFADWLEEQGDAARAEFIRVQCQLGQMLTGDPARKMLAKRERELLNENAMQWLPHCQPLERVSWSFERGLLLVDVAPIRSGHKSFWLRLAALFERLPRACQVRLAELEPKDWEHLKKQEWLARMVTVRLTDVRRVEVFYNPGLQSLLRGTFLAQTGLLECRLPECKNSVAHALADAKHLRHLSRLELTRSGMEARGFKELLHSPHCPVLTYLDLRGSCPGLEGMQHLAAWPGLVHVTHLDIGACGLDASMVKILLQSTYTRNLQALGLNDNHLGSEGARLLVQAKHLGALRSLLLRNNHLDEEGIRLLIESAATPHLTSLDLSRNGNSKRRVALRKLLQKQFGERAKGMAI